MRRRLILTGTALLLALLSAAIWQFRFENAGPAFDLRVEPDFRHWTVKAGERIVSEGDTWLLPPPHGGQAPSIEGRLDGLEARRFVHVGLDAAWDEVTRRDDHPWWSARVSLGIKRDDGTYDWPQDGDVINAEGSRGWHRAECVLDLPPDAGEPRLFINNLAATGNLKVRNLGVTPVVQRPWVPAAVVLVLTAWMAWAAGMIGGEKGKSRQIAAAIGMVVAGWYLVFPQPHHHARPFPGGFMRGAEIAPLPKTVTPPVPAIAPVSFPAPAPPVVAAPVAAPVAVPVKLAPVAEVRTSQPLAMAFRKIDKDWRFAHTAAFLALGLGLYLLVGIRASWLPATGIALLSEVIPNLQRQDFHSDDAVDLVANLAGLLLAAALVRGAAPVLRRLKRRES